MRGRQMSIEERCARLLSRYKVKLDPNTIAVRYQQAKSLMIDRMERWTKVRVEIEKVLREILDEHGIEGMNRISYRNFAFALFRQLKKQPWPPDPRISKALLSFYSIRYELKKGVLRKITVKITNLVKELREKGII
jgi:hypothetical protein